MFFKRVELFGFKSFSEKTKLDFEAGVTAVVGPNGCGKCVDGETEVLLADGRQEKISHLVNRAIENNDKVKILDDGYCAYADNIDQSKVLSLNPRTLRIEVKPILAFVKRKSPQFLLKVKTKTGRTIITTHYHPFFSIRDGEVFSLKAEQLREKVKIALPRRLQTSAHNNALNISSMLQNFCEDDSVYLPYSKELSSYLKTMAGHAGGFNKLAQEIGVSVDRMSSIGQGQALNAAIFSKLLKKQVMPNLPEVANEIKSRGRGIINLPTYLSKDLARFLGYVISEGRNTNSNQIWFVNEDQALINDFVSCSKHVFGVEAKTFSYKACAKDALIFSHALCKFLDRVFGIGIGEGSRCKSVPKQLFTASDDVVDNFLSALFEGDGHICVDKQGQGKYKKNHVYIEYSTASQKLAQDLASLLLRFGVQSIIREKIKCASNTKSKTKRKYYSLYVYGIGNVRRLSQRLNFIGSKAAKLKLIKELDYIGNPNLDLIPEVNKLVKLLTKTAKINVKRLRKISPKLAAYCENRCEASREGLSEVLCIIEEHGQISGLARLILNQLKSLARSDIYWDEIVKIERVKSPEWVYDLTVEGNHNFVANDIIVHNSNIADAIKWVLGEQSVRNMRGSRMEDVIFHGADNVAAVGFAEVSITISNEQKFLPLEYEEVTITRRIFRSGESEYLINKVPVRLKDISELLMGTGMGMPSYSLMQQGKVDNMLSSKPDERRAIFEEAAGITKYKAKREEALRKLTRTQENLQRIGDIIVEVKRQIKSMERQVNKARRYKEEFERLKEFELKVSQHKFQQLKKERSELKANTAQLKEKEQFLSSKISTTVDSLERARNELSSIEENISRIQAEGYEIASTIKTASNKVTLNEERIEELHRRSEYLTQQIVELEEKISLAATQREEAKLEIDSIKEKKQESSTSLEQKEQSIEDILLLVKEAQKQVNDYKLEEVELLTQKTRLKNNLTKFEANLANLNARLRRLNLEFEKTEEEISAIGERARDCQTQIDSVSEETAHLTKELWDLKSNRDIQVEKRQKLDVSLEEISRRITADTSSLNFLKEMTKKHEGFSAAVKAILSAKDSGELNIDGLCGVVANLINVLPEHQLAIETALGESAQALVVENHQAADVAINYLKANNAGMAKFIYLDRMPSPRREKRFANVLGRASEFARVDSKYNDLIKHLLGDALVIQDKNNASDLLRSIDHSDSLVTLKGEVFAKTSIVDGSTLKDSHSSLLGRTERIERMESGLTKANSEKAEIEALRNTQVQEITRLASLIQEKEPNLNKVKIKLAGKESEKHNIETEKKRFEEELSVLKLDIDEAKEQLDELCKDQEAMNQQLSTVEEKELKLKKMIQERQANITEQEALRQRTLVEIAQLKTAAQGLDREVQIRKARLNTLIEAEDQQKDQHQRSKQEQENITTKIEELKQEIEQLKLQVRNLSETKQSLDNKINRTSQKRQELYSNIKKLDEEAKSEQVQLNEVRERRSSLQVKLTELSYKQDSLKEKMQQSYQLDLEASLESIMEITPPEPFVFEEIKQLKGKLEGMGPVNLVALEESDQLQQRYSFLISQQEDLVNGQEALRKAITQINRTAREMFADTFAKIQASFKEYFRILFNGGDARVILLDEHNLLESGIEIVVRPPGKKLQNISLLSGGEKALTAIALLFAIFKVKPSPFCILDEVDAPLDESNVDRFTNLLREFIKTSQFIIITHNKKTINMADIMYGITMERSGVSKIVSVKFTEDEKSSAKETVPVKA